MLGSGGSVPVLMHVTYPTATAHAQNVFYSDTKSKVRPKKKRFARDGQFHGSFRAGVPVPQQP